MTATHIIMINGIDISLQLVVHKANPAFFSVWFVLPDSGAWLIYGVAEGQYSQTGQFEVLLAKGYAYDGNKEQDSQNKMKHGNPYTPDKPP